MSQIENKKINVSVLLLCRCWMCTETKGANSLTMSKIAHRNDSTPSMPMKKEYN